MSGSTAAPSGTSSRMHSLPHAPTMPANRSLKAPLTSDQRPATDAVAHRHLHEPVAELVTDELPAEPSGTQRRASEQRPAAAFPSPRSDARSSAGYGLQNLGMNVRRSGRKNLPNVGTATACVGTDAVDVMRSPASSSSTNPPITTSLVFTSARPPRPSSLSRCSATSRRWLHGVRHREQPDLGPVLQQPLMAYLSQTSPTP